MLGIKKLKNLIFEIALILAIGLTAITLVRLSRTRHIAKFGSPPPGSNTKTLIFFGIWSTFYAIAGWWSLSALILVLVALLVLSQIFGFRALPWSRWQQVRDGGIIASLIVVPILLFVYGGVSG